MSYLSSFFCLQLGLYRSSFRGFPSNKQRRMCFFVEEVRKSRPSNRKRPVELASACHTVVHSWTPQLKGPLKH